MVMQEQMMKRIILLPDYLIGVDGVTTYQFKYDVKGDLIGEEKEEGEVERCYYEDENKGRITVDCGYWYGYCMYGDE
ncbi:MAG: hypothetical protein EZS28_001862 [Streblomastix strix]|uniref:Uncharacterized protein n=1 Tax=Streblomastix strix TaxID=222440 RepID=A0A5J4X6V9_9EUKA|nr:MAG: hypothetical protein EZS28_001862 [Streblomastix strix]